MSSVKSSSSVKSTLADIAKHPTRVAAFMILAERTASPKEIAREIGETVSHVSYHVTELEKLEAIELVKERPVRGAMEHFFRAIKRPFATDSDWAHLSPEERAIVSRDILNRVVVDLAQALEEGTFDSRTNRGLVRFPMLVDPEGFAELNEIEKQAYKRKLEVQARSAERMAKNSSCEKIPTMATSMFFEMPPTRRR